MRNKLIGGFTFALFLSVPFIYNSCQGGMASAQRSAQLNSLCVQKVSPFYSEKNNVTQSLPIASKAINSINQSVVNKDTVLAVIVNNFCAKDNNNVNLLSYKLTKAAGSQKPYYSSRNVAGLNKQTYKWTLEKSYTNNEITAVIDADPCVLGVSLNKTYRLQSLTSPSSLFDDPMISSQNHWQAINYVEAYSLLYNDMTGIMSTGDNILVAIVDTGFDVGSSSVNIHPDLHANLWRHQLGDGVDATSIGTSLVNYSPFDVSANGHGTHLSGLIGAVTNNFTGTMGMIPRRVQIMAVKIFSWDTSLDEITTTSQAVANGIRFAYLNGAKVINLSIGTLFNGVNDDPIMKDAIQDAVAAGAVVVGVIGNSTTGNGAEVDGGATLSSIPGQYGKDINGMITVGSVDADTLTKSYFSHYSTTYTEMMAPGADSDGIGLYSTIPKLIDPKTGYGRLMGTSQAAPIVAGAAALVMQFVRDRTGVYPSPAAVETFLKETAAKPTTLQDYVQSNNLLDLQLVAQRLQATAGMIGTASVGFDCL